MGLQLIDHRQGKIHGGKNWIEEGYQGFRVKIKNDDIQNFKQPSFTSIQGF